MTEENKLEKDVVTIYKDDDNPILVYRREILDKYSEIGISEKNAKTIYRSPYINFFIIKGEIQDKNITTDNPKNYRNLEGLATGGYGAVYRAERVATSELVAIKVINKEKDKGFTAYKEIQVSRLLKNCENVLKLQSFFEDKKNVYIVYDFIDGGDIYEKKFEMKDIKNIVKKIINALICIHRYDYVYADLKPENIMVSKDLNKVVLVDLGSVMNNPYNDQVGTMLYMAPETIEGRTSNTKVDNWALGAITYEMITGKVLFDSEFTSDIMMKIIRVDYKLPSDFPEDAGDFIKKLLRKDPNNRMSLEDALNHPFLKN